MWAGQYVMVMKTPGPLEGSDPGEVTTMMKGINKAAKNKPMSHWRRLISSLANQLGINMPKIRNRAQAMLIYNELKLATEPAY